VVRTVVQLDPHVVDRVAGEHAAGEAASLMPSSIGLMNSFGIEPWGTIVLEDVAVPARRDRGESSRGHTAAAAGCFASSSRRRPDG